MHESIRFHAFPLAGIEPMSATTVRSFPRHTHDQYGIGLVDSGGHASWSGRGPVEAGPGHFICVNPGEVHDGRAIGRRARSWRILYFEPALLETLRADILDGATPSFTFEAPVFADGPMRHLFEAAFAHSATVRSGLGPPSSAGERSAAATTRQVDAMPSETAVLELVARLGLHSTRRPPRPAPAACIRRARDRIDADPAAHMTLSELAAEARISRYQLVRAFARDLGLTPHAYIIQRRIALARRLIRTGCALAEVAAETGFYDQSHFTHCFVRQFGVTPRRYCNFFQDGSAPQSRHSRA
jgi:AraC-like DNA-binding protein